MKSAIALVLTLVNASSVWGAYEKRPLCYESCFAPGNCLGYDANNTVRMTTCNATNVLWFNINFKYPKADFQDGMLKAYNGDLCVGMKGGIPKNAGPPNVKEKVPLVVEQCALVKNNPAFKWELYKGGDNRDDFIRNSVDKDWCIMADIKAAKPTEGKLLTGMKVNAVHKCGKDTYDPLWFGQQWLTAQHTADFGPWEDCYKCITTPWEECTCRCNCKPSYGPNTKCPLQVREPGCTCEEGYKWSLARKIGVNFSCVT